MNVKKEDSKEKNIPTQSTSSENIVFDATLLKTIT